MLKQETEILVIIIRAIPTPENVASSANESPLYDILGFFDPVPIICELNSFLISKLNCSC